MGSVVLVSFIISLFPVITNGTTGLLRVDPALLDLFRLYRASRLDVCCVCACRTPCPIWSRRRGSPAACR